MKKNSATFRNRRTRVTFERISVGRACGAAVRYGLASPGPVYGDAYQGRNSGQGEHEGVAQAGELAGAQRELEAVDRPRRDVERRVAPDRPVDRAQEQPLRAGVDDSRVGDHVAGPDDDDPAARPAVGQAR